MRILLLVTAFNGLSQRTWCALREAGHEVGVLFATSEGDTIKGVAAAKPDLIICPFLKERVPARVWQRWRTVIIHPGPVGDRGPSSLDWAITEGARSWGVTALQAVEEMDAGPIWATRTFAVPDEPPRKSSLYGGPVADAALECVFEVVEKAQDPAFTPVPADQARPRPPMRQADRAFDWGDPTEQIVRKIRAADGAPGVRAELGGLPIFGYDAVPGLGRAGRPGQLLSRRQGAVLVGTGDGSVWLGHVRAADPSHGRAGIKLPATTLLGARLRGVPHSPLPPGAEPEHPAAYRQISYRRAGPVGWLTFDFYNGAMAPGHCRRLAAGLRHAAGQDTEVLVLRGGTDAFSNGIHLNVIEASPDPASAAWANIRAMNEVCREIIMCTRQVVIAAYAGSAGAGGVMLGLGADIVAARDGIVLNPYYDIGLYGSELHTFTLPRRVGPERAQQLLDDKVPLSCPAARAIGLVDEVGPRDPDAYGEWLQALAERESDGRTARNRRQQKARRLAAERVPLEVYEARELAEMSRDMYADRSGFARERHAFVRKVKPAATPPRLLFKGTAPRRRATVLRPAVPVSA
ncbi:enoyl-CoA hydratase-related protein [Actinoplanes subtropicus]|uniref:enoyl-CoA hydratase-related protein n=1 Tax=Actinoplanes subtropicus TaxID=543632 RepID=UPI0004C42281|nr:enoyl-CoA hydratase-related protein [Actinoplanes subtropicus]